MGEVWENFETDEKFFDDDKKDASEEVSEEVCECIVQKLGIVVLSGSEESILSSLVLNSI